MDNVMAEAIALHLWAVIAEGANAKLTPAERGVVVRAIAARAHAHPDGAGRGYGRSTIDRWIRDWRRGGLPALGPQPRSDSGWCEPARSCSGRRSPCAWSYPPARRPRSPRSSGPATGCGCRPARGAISPRRRGLHRQALAAEPKVFGRYEAARLGRVQGGRGARR
jgi:putative transposase